MTRTELLNSLIKKNNYKSYLEIGVNVSTQQGWNWKGIEIELKHGVDPEVDTTYKMTSDDFFKLNIPQTYDLIFVDGLHLAEQAYTDIKNSLKKLNENGTIVVHDCNPIEEITQRRVRESAAWHGDVWKAILKLRIEEPDLEIFTVDTDEGCAIIRKGKQECFVKPTDTKIYNFDFFDKNRRQALNLISVDEFKEKYLK
jgi:hypothetical protein